MIKEPSILSSCLTDKPVNSVDDDNLKAIDYANALAQFIKNASTPVTIGIQGGWGSGKTSLITVLKHELEEDQNHQALCVVVNAWEHSLFQAQEGRAEVALSLLSGLSEGLLESINNADWLDKQSKKLVENESATLNKAIGGIKCALLFAGKVATQMLSNMVGGGDVSNVKIENSTQALANIPQMFSHVRKLRLTINEMVEQITYKEKPVKIVFFIDDLDRVPPATAIEILDITKNIFDIKNCIFVLAIDYEVVVKGLEDKFGAKTRENEREFRQYFDKIIQIPFTMPLGAYGESLSQMLASGLAELGYTNQEEDKGTLLRLSKAAKLATGGLPRSIKRIINTVSLLQHVANSKQKKNEVNDQPGLPPDIEVRFIIVALHINFPEIAARLMERPAFLSWDPEELNTSWDLKLEDNKSALMLLEKDQLFDEAWEKVVYCLCAGSEWLKPRARQISQLLNQLRNILGGENKTSLPDEGLIKLNSILKGISVVSIENPTGNESKIKMDDIDKFYRSLAKDIDADLPDADIEKNKEVELNEEGIFSWTPGLGGKMVYMEVDWYPEANEIISYVVSQRNGVTQRDSRSVIEKMAGDYEWDFEGANFWYAFTEPFTRQDFSDLTKTKILASRIVKLYQDVDTARNRLKK